MQPPRVARRHAHMVRLHPFATKNRLLWKASLRSAGTLEHYLTGEWNVVTRVYRWRWLARLVARWHTFAPTDGFLTSAIVEPYWPGENVIPFPLSGDRQRSRAPVPTLVRRGSAKLRVVN